MLYLKIEKTYKDSCVWLTFIKAGTALSILTNELRQFLKKDSFWIWDENTQRGFEFLKKTIMLTSILRYFDEKMSVTLSNDINKN